MNDELEKKFYDRFRFFNLYEMEYGFRCRDGWFNLIWNLCIDLEQMGFGENKDDCIVQIKEKLGGLRFYVDGATKEQQIRIRKAEEESYEICEVCGVTGKLRNDLGWIQTLCDKCYSVSKKKK